MKMDNLGNFFLQIMVSCGQYTHMLHLVETFIRTIKYMKGLDKG